MSKSVLVRGRNDVLHTASTSQADVNQDIPGGDHQPQPKVSDSQTDTPEADSTSDLIIIQSGFECELSMETKLRIY